MRGVEGTELKSCAFDINSQRMLGDAQFLGNLATAETACQIPQRISLARRKRLSRGNRLALKLQRALVDEMRCKNQRLGELLPVAFPS